MNLFLKRLGGFYKYRFLMQQLVTKDIKLKYRRSFLGYLWSILNPLMVMVIMVIVFSNMFRSDITNFPIYRLQNHKFLCKYDICSGGTYYRIYRVPGSPECILPVHSGDSFAGISVLPGTGNAVSTGMCILP